MDEESLRASIRPISPARKKQKKLQRDMESSMDSRQRDSVSPSNGRQLPPLYPSRPTSTISDNARDEDPQTKPPRKKKNTTMSQETLVEAEETPRRSVDGDQAVKKKKKKKRAINDDPNNIGLATELYDLGDDVVTKPSEPEPIVIPVTMGTMKSQPTNKLFIEQKSGFKVAEKSKVAQRRADDEARRAALASQALSAEAQQSTIQLALWTHVGLERAFQFLRGLLAGISLWQIISTYMLLNNSSEDFLTNYYMLASPLQCLYFFLFAVSLVSVLDRYDVARPTYTCMIQSVTCQAGTVAVLFYFIGLVFSVSTAFMDQRIGLYDVNPALWNVTTTTSDVLYDWSVLNVIRGVMAMLGFLIVCCSKPADRLRETLQITDRNILDIEETQEPTSITIKSNTAREFAA